MVDRYLGIHRADGSTVLELSTTDALGDPFTVENVDLGSIGAREDVEPDPAGSGTVDRTTFTDGSGVSVPMRISSGHGQGAHYWYEVLREACQVENRYFLHIGLAEWAERRRIAVVGRDMPRLLGNPRFVDITAQWKSPDGYLEDLEQREVWVRAVADGTDGLFEPLFEPIYTPPADVGEQGPFDVGGRARTWWEADIYGDCRGAPRLTHASGWQFVGRGDLSIPPGHFVRVVPHSPVGPRVLYDGDPTQDLYGQVDWSVTRLRQLERGANTMQLTASAYSTGFGALVRWRRRWP